MRRYAKGAIATATAVGIAAGALAGTASGTGNHTRGFDITVENLTGGQPLSPPLLVEHNRRAGVWSAGDVASAPVSAVAEDANNPIAESALSQLPGVYEVTTGVEEGAGGPAPIPPGASQTYRIAVPPHHGRISLLSMLVNTNDAFTGIDSLRLRNRKVVIHARAYDAGTEKNNQLASHIPGPVGNNPFVRDPEGELIRMHPGVQPGVGDLDPAVHGWTGPVAKITITPVK